MDECPLCGGSIKEEAIICRHCRSRVPVRRAQGGVFAQRRHVAETDASSFGFLILLVLFFGAVIVTAYAVL